jgi:transcriptional regulator
VYLPDHFNTFDTDTMHHVIDAAPFATVVTLGADGIAANHIPLLLDRNRGEHGTLVGHVARNNDLWRQGQHDGETLVIFQSAEGYISPNWYPTKQLTHEVVPTWNYVVVHVYGQLIVHEDEKWLRGVVGRLTQKMETITSARPWKMADAPKEYTRQMLGNIVGIEIPVTRIVGKAKLGQNRPLEDRLGAARGLETTGDPGDHNLAMQMIAAMEKDAI